jgi:predicted ATPase
MPDKNLKLIVISGCSGGGKSTLITELSKMGYSVIHEAATRVLEEQLAADGLITPWKNPLCFCELLIARAVDDFHRANSMTDPLKKIIFFDRSFLEGIRWYNTFNSVNSDQYDNLIEALRYFHSIYITPPWKEIYDQNDFRRHSFDKSVDDYQRVAAFYSECGYQLQELPKVNVRARADFILSATI